MKLSKLAEAVGAAVNFSGRPSSKEPKWVQAETPLFTKADAEALKDRYESYAMRRKAGAEDNKNSLLALSPKFSEQVKETPKSSCSRDEQIKILGAAASEFFNAPDDEFSARKSIESLQPWRFEQELVPRVELLFGLCRTALGQHVEAIAHFDAILAKEPLHRSALVYRYIAKTRGLWTVSPQQNAAICADTRAHLSCAKEDWFGRLISAEVDHSSWTEEETLRKFHDIASDHPTKALVWSMLSAEMFRQTIVFQRPTLLPDANKYAFKALQIQWLEPLSYSVLFHSGAVVCDERWTKLAKGHWDSYPLRVPAFDVLKTDPNRICFMPLGVDDGILRSQLFLQGP